jgi:hypothetical protein
MTTYLELVNKVLVRLREDEVTTVNETPYSKLIGAFVTDALRQVEEAWDWSGLRTTFTATTQENIFNYVLTGSGKNVKIIDVINDTDDHFMEYRGTHWFNNFYLNNNANAGSPRYYTFNGFDDEGNTQVDVAPKPNGVYTLRFNAIVRTEELVSDTDTIAVPTLPVVQLAVALATRERGESGGNLTPELFSTAERTLSDSIALDASKHPEETIFIMV